MITFINNGNDCYLISALQVLLNAYPFTNIFAEDTEQEHIIMKGFRTLCHRNELTGVAYFKKALSEFDSEAEEIFGNTDQQDSYMALMKILDIIHHYTKEKVPNYENYGIINTRIKKESFEKWKEDGNVLGMSAVTTYFTGQFRTQTKCGQCGNLQNSFERFESITLSLTGESVTECLSNFISPEFVEDYMCDNCKNKGVTRITTLWKFPLLLIINIVRTRHTKFGAIKIGSLLTMDKSIKIKSSANIYKYVLQSVIYHYGGATGSGHYTVDLNKDGIWYSVNDESVVRLKGLAESSKNCFLLVYKFCS